jgi:hypothetical protein
MATQCAAKPVTFQQQQQQRLTEARLLAAVPQAF